MESSSRDPSNHLSLARDLEEWHRRIDQEVTQRKEENKVLEEKFLADVHGLKPGTEWERVARSPISSLYCVQNIFASLAETFLFVGTAASTRRWSTARRTGAGCAA